MGESTGLIMFLWIVGAPTIGFVILSMWSPPKAVSEDRHVSTSATQPRYGADQSNPSR